MTLILKELIGAVIFLIAAGYLMKRRRYKGIPEYAQVFDAISDRIYFASSWSDIEQYAGEIKHFNAMYTRENKALIYGMTRDLNILLEKKKDELKNQLSLKQQKTTYQA